MRHLFPEVVSYNRFVELEREIAIPLILFIKKVLLGKFDILVIVVVFRVLFAFLGAWWHGD